MESLTKTIHPASLEDAQLLAGCAALLLTLTMAIRVRTRRTRRPRRRPAQLASLIGFALALASSPAAANPRKPASPSRPSLGAAPPWSDSGDSPPRSPDQTMVPSFIAYGAHHMRDSHPREHSITLDDVLRKSSSPGRHDRRHQQVPRHGQHSSKATSETTLATVLADGHEASRRVSLTGRAFDHPAFHGHHGHQAGVSFDRLFPRFSGKPTIAPTRRSDRDEERERLASMRAHPAGKALIPQMPPREGSLSLAAAEPAGVGSVPAGLNEDSAGRFVYRVKEGDTLWSIAQKHLRTDDPRTIARYWPLIHRENRTIVGPDPNLIVPGQDLVLP